MKYLKLFEEVSLSEKSLICSLCEQYVIMNYNINKDGSIDVDKNVSLWFRRLKKIPLKFNKINGRFDCSNNRLTTLEGSPIEVNGNFLCYNNKLTSFKFAPKIIRGEFNCNCNNIKSFEYFPNFVKEDFECYANPIWRIWKLFEDTTKIELLNDFDIFRDEETEEPVIIMDRLNDFLLTIGKDPVKNIDKYKNI